MPRKGRAQAKPAAPTHPRVPRPASPLHFTGGEPVRVVHLTAEYWPFARTGGLAEAVSSLATFQEISGLPTTVVMPLHRTVREAAPDLEPVGPPFAVQVGPQTEHARLFRIAGDPAGPRVFFIEHLDYFNRPGIYGENGPDYPDNARRFAFFCLAALRVLPQIVTAPLVLHAHDWHTALGPVYLRTAFGDDAFYRRVATVLSVHNAGFQGHFPPETMADLDLPQELYNWQAFEWYGRVNLLKGGLAHSGMVTTVSPTHAHELRTPAGGFGLHEMFISLRDRLVGIVNGIDLDIWNPATDPQITARYSADDQSGKLRCKAALQRSCGLQQRRKTPIFGMTARLVTQKGLDLILGGDVCFTTDAQFVFLGEGEHRYETALTDMAAAAPDRIGVELNFTDPLEHRLLAGADLLLMPSLYEPCGLTQMRAQRYGAIPVARRVGGLADTIEDGVTGFLFDPYTPAGLEEAVRRAVDQYADHAAWEKIVREAMGRDFGWERSAAKYLEVYRRALELMPGAS